MIALQKAVGNRAVARLFASDVVQRDARWVPGSPSHNLPIAPGILDRRENWGYTPALLNGTRVLGEGDATRVLLPPKFAISHGPQGGVTAMIDEVPTNVGSYDMELPVRPPWGDEDNYRQVQQFLQDKRDRR